jgi:trans-aconitate methyltransferase
MRKMCHCLFSGRGLKLDCKLDVYENVYKNRTSKQKQTIEVVQATTLLPNREGVSISHDFYPHVQFYIRITLAQFQLGMCN